MKTNKIIISALSALAIMSSCSADIEQQAPTEKDVIEASEFKNIEVKEQSIETTELAYRKTPKQIVKFENGRTLQRTIDGTYIYQGDIILTDEQVECLKTTGSIFSQEDSIPTKAGIVWFPKQMWKNNTIHYGIRSDMTAETKQYVREAIAHWQAMTNLNFIEGMSLDGTILFYNGDGCHSLVGRHGYTQEISIDADWGKRGNVIHEIGHAVGLIHEHCLPCRDGFININFNNIKDDWKSQYEKEKDVLATNVIDLTSIMLYGSYAGSDVAVNPSIPVMTMKDGTTWEVQRNGLSDIDRVMVNALYK